MTAAGAREVFAAKLPPVTTPQPALLHGYVGEPHKRIATIAEASLFHHVPATSVLTRTRRWWWRWWRIRRRGPHRLIRTCLVQLVALCFCLCGLANALVRRGLPRLGLAAQIIARPCARLVQRRAFRFCCCGLADGRVWCRFSGLGFTTRRAALVALPQVAKAAVTLDRLRYRVAGWAFCALTDGALGTYARLMFARRFAWRLKQRSPRGVVHAHSLITPTRFTPPLVESTILVLYNVLRQV